MALVTLNPGDDVAAIVSGGTAGSTYTFSPGTYRHQSITPKTGDIYQAATLGTVILTGARVLSSWTYDGAGHWYATGQTQQNLDYNPNYECMLGHDGCFYPEQLWVNDVLYEHMTTLGAVAAGKWFFDYATDRIYIPVDPTGKTIETSVTPQAFSGGGTNGVIRKLVVEKYANAAQVPSVAVGAGWVVEDCEIRHSHGMGLKTGSRSIQRRNKVHHMGQLGIGGSGANIQILNNEVYENNVAYFGDGVYGEFGGTKFVLTTDILIKDNFIHHNHGPGLWCDVNNIRAVYDSNIVEDNDARGIFDEVGYGSIIKNNQVRRNGFHPEHDQGPVAHAGILVSSCRDVEVYGNIVEDNFCGIGAQETNRPTPTPPAGYGPHDLVNLYVHDNIVRQLDTGRATGVSDFDPNANPFTATANNRWRGNTYQLGPSTKFRWSAGDITYAAWLAIPQDGESVSEPPTTPPPAPDPGDPDPPAPTPPPTPPPAASTGAVRGVFDPPPKILSSRLGDVYYIGEDRALTPMDGIGSLPEMTGHFPQLQVDGTWRVDPPEYCRRTQGGCQVSPGDTTLLTVGSAAPTTTGAAANVDSDSGPFLQLTTSSSPGNTVGLATAFAVSRRAWEPDWTAVIQTDASVDDIGFWIGYFSGSPDNDAEPALHVAAFRYYTDTDDTAFWTAVTSDGAAITTTVTEIPIDVTTTYRLRIRMLEGAVVFFVDDESVATHDTDLPDISEPLGWGVRVTTLAASAKALAISRVEFTQR